MWNIKMIRKVFTAIAGTLFVAGASSALAAGDIIPDSYIVVTNGEPLEHQIQSITPQSTMHSFGMVVKATRAQIAGIEQLPQVISVEPNQWVSFDQFQDTSPDNLWGLDRVDQRDLPLNDGYEYQYDGRGVDIYVIDTGVNINHQEFGSRGRHGWDFVDNDNDATDCQGHGTHVAGIAAGSTYGVAKGANVVAVRVGTCDRQGQLDWVISAIDWVAEDHKAKVAAQPDSFTPSVINMSITAGASEVLDSAVRAAIAQGITFVTSAGNARADSCDYSPGRLTEVVNVAASTQWDTRWGFSNYKACVDLFAPGSNIKSAWYDSETASSHQSGTSMASPHVAGAAALYLQQNRALNPAQVQSLLTASASKNKLRINSGTANKLLFTQLEADEPVDDGVARLTNGQALDISDYNRWETRTYKIEVPQGVSQLSVKTIGARGDYDLYVNPAKVPDDNIWACKRTSSSSNETCVFDSPLPGFYYIKVRAYSVYGVTDMHLKAEY